jgi:glutamate N-acetyltransferase/amino-acid N-acetyltransferase
MLVCSTGRIGVQLPMPGIRNGIEAAAAALSAGGLATAAEAIWTTDTKLKLSTRTVGGSTVAGIAKGAAMIFPDMVPHATMLAFVVTDAAVPAPALQRLLAEAADASFNAITVDSDTSTSDTLLLLATGRAGNRESESSLDGFAAALLAVLTDLAHQVVRDGEGAQKFVAVTVKGAVDAASARRIGLAIANSPLVKTAIAGGDANWGRVIMAVGKSTEPIEMARLGVAFGGHEVARDGAAVPDLDEAPVAAHLAGREIAIEVVVGNGAGTATVWTCDLTHGYIDINADYRS